MTRTSSGARPGPARPDLTRSRSAGGTLCPPARHRPAMAGAGPGRGGLTCLCVCVRARENACGGLRGDLEGGRGGGGDRVGGGAGPAGPTPGDASFFF